MQRRILPARTHPHENKRRRQAETDGVAQTVELGAEFTHRLRQPGDVTVQRVEQHGRNDEPAADGKIVFAFGSDLAGVGDGGETADGVAERQKSGDDGDLFHGFTALH